MYSSISRLRSAMVAAGCLTFFAFGVQAQSHEAPLLSDDQLVSPSAVAAPYALFQYASLTGTGNTINGTQLPIVLANGKTVFKNFTLLFNVDVSGNISIATGYPQTVNAPPPIVNSFKAGKYIGPTANSTFKIVVAGPSSTAGGATEWSISTPPDGDSCTYPGSGFWYVGPNANNPLAARLSAAKITSTAWSYGVVSSPCGTGGFWDGNALIGVSQIGNTISLVSFTQDGHDSALPVAQMTYTLAP